MDYELVVIGGGPAGLAAALSAYRHGLKKILILERDRELGGILNQCVHAGFGLHYFNEELTGPEYAERFITQVEKTPIEVSLDTMALELIPGARGGCAVHAVSKAGYRIISAASAILAMGCRERTRGALNIPGARPAGVFTAGTAQRYINLEGRMVGSRIVILGSGDVGLIMARRLTLEGAKVLACAEILPKPGGLTRNIVQCLDDFDIPLYLSHTITDIRGKRRVESVTISRVDEKRRPIPGTERVVDCDTVLVSAGLIPENELTRRAGIALDPKTGGAAVDGAMAVSAPGIFACGNVVHVLDLADHVSEEGEKAGESAAAWVRGRPKRMPLRGVIESD
ncbi:MAG: NAD(P)/FAD-dependent oxidoreductase [Treponema sp.]|jgi:NADPH-dependent 2,4-dienoyl-CoA reductase/sulfur reductase-like enzyme|nr:NAD(P)/FAD-dependent oxidoreductase [Treponema sp.]